MEIVRYPDPRLMDPSRKVTREELRMDGTQNLIDEMLAMLADNESNGWLGLSANQIGSDLKIFVCRLDVLRVVINPKITTLPGSTELLEEGCISLEGLNMVVGRSMRVRMEYLDRDGRLVLQTLTGNYARVAQHERDHLNGRLILDSIK